jgi:hypothetical protein
MDFSLSQFYRTTPAFVLRSFSFFHIYVPGKQATQVSSPGSLNLLADSRIPPRDLVPDFVPSPLAGGGRCFPLELFNPVAGTRRRISFLMDFTAWTRLPAREPKGAGPISFFHLVSFFPQLIRLSLRFLFHPRSRWWPRCPLPRLLSPASILVAVPVSGFSSRECSHA